MKIVLRSDVTGLGKRGDITDVADGYARNYLIPKGLANRATAGSEREAAAMRRAHEARNAQEKAGAEAIASRVVGKPVLIAARAGEGGRLFGSVTVADIVRAVAEQHNVELDRRSFHLDEPLKSLGVHEVPVRLHSEVAFAVTVEVIAD